MALHHQAETILEEIEVFSPSMILRRSWLYPPAEVGVAVCLGDFIIMCRKHAFWKSDLSFRLVLQLRTHCMPF
jgi:hypothetical protein